MSETSAPRPLIQVYTVYIRASKQAVWEGITSSEYTQQWGYAAPMEFEPTVGSTYRHLTTDQMKQMGMGDVAVSGEVLACDPYDHLELTWLPSWHPELPATRLIWDLTEYPGGLTKVVLTHDLTAAPSLAAEVAGGGDPSQGGGGWPWSLSGLKTLLETGHSMD